MHITKFEVYMLGNMACWVLFVVGDETPIDNRKMRNENSIVLCSIFFLK